MERWTMWAIIRKLYIKHLFIGKLNKYINKSFVYEGNLPHLQHLKWQCKLLWLRRLRGFFFGC